MSNNDDDFYDRYTAADRRDASGEDSSSDWPDLHAVGRQHAEDEPHGDLRFDPEQTVVVTSDFLRAGIAVSEQRVPHDPSPQTEYRLERDESPGGAHHAADSSDGYQSGHTTAEEVGEDSRHRWPEPLGSSSDGPGLTEPQAAGDDRSPSRDAGADPALEAGWGDPRVDSPQSADAEHVWVSGGTDDAQSRAAHRDDWSPQDVHPEQNPPNPDAYGWESVTGQHGDGRYRHADSGFQPPVAGPAPYAQSAPHDDAGARPHPALPGHGDLYSNVRPPQWATPHPEAPNAQPHAQAPANWQYGHAPAPDGRIPARYPAPTHQDHPGQRAPGAPAPSSPDRHAQYGPLRQTPSSSVGVARATIREAELVRPHKPEPTMGWRKTLRKLTRINLGPSPAERKWIDLERRIKSNLRGTYLIAVMGEKGGVSKTTTTVGLGQALAHYRDDKVVAVDGNTAKGNLSDRIDEPSKGTWQTLLRDENLHAYSDFRYHLGKDSSSGLEVLASDRGDEVIKGWQLDEAVQRLGRQYPVRIVDCGNQLRDDVTAAVLNLADAVVIVSTTNLDGAKGAGETINFLLAHGYPHLVHQAVVVISNVSKVPATKAVRHLHEDFERVVRAVHAIPYDPHLHEAAAIDMHRLQPETRRAFIEAAASVGDGFTGAADRDQIAPGPARAAEPRR